MEKDVQEVSTEDKWYTPLQEILGIVTQGKEKTQKVEKEDILNLISNGTKSHILINRFNVDIFGLLRVSGGQMGIGFFFDNGYNLADLALLGATFDDLVVLLRGEKLFKSDRKGGLNNVTSWKKYKSFMDVELIKKIWRPKIKDIFEGACNGSMTRFAGIGFSTEELLILNDGEVTVARTLIDLGLKSKHLCLFSHTEFEWFEKLGLTTEDIEKRLGIHEQSLLKSLGWTLQIRGKDDRQVRPSVRIDSTI
jgi:hypothetical protein